MVSACNVLFPGFQGSFERFFATFLSHLWFETWAEAMPGNCGTEARCFRYSTYWFPGESYFSIAALSTERLVKLSDHRPWRFACCTFFVDCISFFIAFRWGSFTSRWSNRCRSSRTISCTLIRWICQLLQRFIATACYYCARINHANDLPGIRKARQFREIQSTV